MEESKNESPVTNDVLQSDHHVHMSDEEIAKARAHHAKRHSGDNPQQASGAGRDKKKIPVKPR